MTDLELVRACAEVMGISDRVTVSEPYIDTTGSAEHKNHITYAVPYDPLHNASQAFALVEKLKLEARFNEHLKKWIVTPSYTHEPEACNADLKRAICLCAAKAGGG